MPSQSYLELARHAAAVMDHSTWRALVKACNELNRGLTLDDVSAVAVGLERAYSVFQHFPGRRPCETVH
jgi:hypothetical protein